MDLLGISVTVDDCLDQDQACILPVVKMFGKRLSAYSYALKSDSHTTKSIHFTLIVQ